MAPPLSSQLLAFSSQAPPVHQPLVGAHALQQSAPLQRRCPPLVWAEALQQSAPLQRLCPQGLAAPPPSLRAQAHADPARARLRLPLLGETLGLARARESALVSIDSPY